MKNITLLLLLILSSCKSEPKTETVGDKEIDPTVHAMWHSFTESYLEFKKEELPDSWYFHNNKEDADRLATLTLNGKKTAMTSGLYAWYKEANADLPTVGTKHIVTDFEGKARAIIKITAVNTIPFNKLSKEDAAMDMGTNVEPLKKWKKAHWDFFSSVMAEKGERPTEDMRIVFERFERIWP